MQEQNGLRSRAGGCSEQASVPGSSAALAYTREAEFALGQSPDAARVKGFNADLVHSSPVHVSAAPAATGARFLKAT
jgi:hypothetical protein